MMIVRLYSTLCCVIDDKISYTLCIEVIYPQKRNTPPQSAPTCRPRTTRMRIGWLAGDWSLARTWGGWTDATQAWANSTPPTQCVVCVWEQDVDGVRGREALRAQQGGR